MQRCVGILIQQMTDQNDDPFSEFEFASPYFWEEEQSDLSDLEKAE